MNRADLKANATLASTFINQAILRLQRELRVPFMEKTIIYTIPTPSLGYVAIPNDLLELIDINIDSDGDGIIDYPLQRVQLKQAMTASQVTDIPRVFARKGGRWIIGPQPVSGAIVEIIYYAEFAPLVNPTDTNTIAKVGWDAVVYGALSAAADYFNDERGPAFEARYKQIAQMLQEQADGDELTADAAMRPALLLNNDYTQNDGLCW
jgi:hypothetical protein